MKIIKELILPEIKLIKPTTFNDDRGFFFESFNKQKFDSLVGSNIDFIQDNHSLSKKNVVRGLHYQVAPFEQTKLIRVISGEIFDVAVDIRKDSETFGLWVGEILSAENKHQLFIPNGFAHGFCVLSDYAEVNYKVSGFYSKESERSIHWIKNDFNILWPINERNAILSQKDTLATSDY